MPLSLYCCTHCGFWQRRAAEPASCPVCEDFRHPHPPNGYRFLTADAVDAQTSVSWDKVADGIWMFRCEPAVGIGPCGFLIERPEGNVAFEGASWYSDEALDFIAERGGVQVLSSSHAHVYGGLWRVAERFQPQVVVQREVLPFAQAFTAQPDIPARPFDEREEVLPGVHLIHTGGHTEGHTVLHLPEQETLFCGDALKFSLDPVDEAAPHIGHATAISCHLAYDAHLPLSHAAIRGYRRVLEPLAFDTVITPWEVIRAGAPAGRMSNREAMRRLFAEQLDGPPSADLMPIPMPDAADLHDPDAIRRYRAAAPEGEVFEFPITPLDHTGVPVWAVAQWQADGEAVSGVGYGDTDERARIGAWGEMMEGILVHGAQALPTRRASYEALQSEGVPALDPLKLRLPVGTDYASSMERLWVEARRYAPGTDGHDESVWVLLEEAAAHFHDLPDGYDPLFTPITNGLGAGDTLARCLQHALLELVQRDGNSASYRALDRRLGIELDAVSDPDLRDLLERYDRAGIDLTVKLADDAFGMANLYVVGHERDPSRAPHPLVLTGCGEAAHPDRKQALAKALREYAASRVRKTFMHGSLEKIEDQLPADYVRRIRAQPPSVEESHSLEAVREWAHLSPEETIRRIDDTILAVEDTVPFSRLPHHSGLDTPQALLDETARRMIDDGLDVLYVDLAPEQSPARAVKAIVPGLEVETMTYWRIGPRNLRRLMRRIEQDDPLVPDDLVGLGTPPDGAQRVPLTEADEAALGGPAWFNRPVAEKLLGPLYAMYREPDLHVVALSEEGVVEA